MTPTAPLGPIPVSAALRLDAVSVHYGAVRALDKLSIALNSGEFLTLLGPSGSGKTTSLRLIAGFVAPSAGRLYIAGRDATRLPPQHRNIGMVFQDYALFPHMSVLANVCYPLEARGVNRSERQRRGAAMLEIVGLGSYAERWPRELSGGQQQRVALARALVFKPDIVLLDEPLAALDKKLRGQMQLEILHIVRQVGATVVAVTHDQEEALVMSERIAVFNHGRLEQIGTPQELYTQPRSEFVADFIGEANLLRGRVHVHADQVVIDGLAWRARLPKTDPRAARLGDGQPVCVVVRPEHMRVEPSSESRQNAHNHTLDPCAHGVVEDRIYLGVEYRLVVRTASGERLTLRSREVAMLAALHPGTPVCLNWSSDDLVVIAP